MRLVTWNCAGKFREKFELVSRLEADLYVIQECEDPQVCRHEAYREFASHGLWTGEKPYKGLGVFARNGTSLSRLDWEPYCLRHFLPVRVNDSWNLLAVWAAKPHIEEYYVDYAFVAPQRLLSCEIVQDECFACSDHRPLVVDITL